MFSSRTPQVSATRDIVFRSKAQRPWPPPSPPRYPLAYFLSVSPAPRGRSKDFCALSDFPPCNHKKCTRPFFIKTENIRFAAGSFHFTERPQFFSISLH